MDVIWVKTYLEFVDYIMIYGLPDAICFDHDLNDGEIWKIYENNPIFSLSSFGNIRKNDKDYMPTKAPTGLTFSCGGKNICLHRAIASTFISNPLNKPQVNHIDGNRYNNHISNLEWVNNSENVKHSHTFLFRNYSAYGENHNNSKTISQYTKDGKLLEVFGGVNEAARQLDIEFTNIAKCARGERKIAGGFMWKYENLLPTIESKIKYSPRTRKQIAENFFIPEYKEKTGYDCAVWLVNYCMDNKCTIPKWNIQSANPVGKENIKKLLENYESNVYWGYPR